MTLTGLQANTPYHYRVKSRDAAGNLANSADFTFTTLMGTVADLTPPAVSMTAPLSGATVSGTVTVSASASDNVGVVGVQFTLDGANLGAEVTTVPYAFSWNTTTATNAAHTLTAVARDLAGNTTTSTAVTVTVSNTVAPPSANLVAAYSYDEGAGMTAADASVNKNTATLSGASWSSGGKFGNAVSFNSTSSYVEAVDIDALTPGTGATFEAWVYLNSAPTEIASVFNKWSQTVDDEYLFGINPNQTLSFSWQTTGGYTWGTPSFNGAGGTGLIPLNAWTHIAVARSGATLNFYINGNLDASLNVMDTNAFRNGINTLRMGGQGRGATNRFFNGQIDEVRIYNRTLTQAEIQNDMNSPIGVAPPPSDTTPPTVSITAPVTGAIVSGSVTVSANATDSVGVVGVQFKLDGANLGAELMAAPYATSWNTAVSSPGAHTLTAVARDAAGNTATSASVSVTVADMTLPTVSITAPANGATISGTISVSANATDNVGVVGVQFKLDGVNLGAEVLAVPYAVSWATTTAVNGAHTLTAVARDAAGNTATAPAISVTVGNDTTPPSVSMTAPSAGATVSGTITVSANATDNVGVVGVQFKLDGVNLGAEVTVTPYTLSWNTTTATNAAHTLTAVARDAAGNSTTSAGISVTVASATVSITAPLNSATLTNLTKVTVKAASGIGLTSILVYSDNILIGTVSCSTTSPCSNTTNTLNWHTNNLAAGPHSLYVVATDTFGNSSSSAPITVNK